MGDVEEQERLAELFESAIDTIEERITVVDERLVVAEVDPEKDNLDPDIVNQLLDSLQAVNEDIANRELALSDIGFDNPGEGHA